MDLTGSTSHIYQNDSFHDNEPLPGSASYHSVAGSECSGHDSTGTTNNPSRASAGSDFFVPHSTYEPSPDDLEGFSSFTNSRSQPVPNDHVTGVIEPRPQEMAELILCEQTERAEDLDGHAKEIPPEPQSLDWLNDMDLNMLVYEMEDLEWRVFEVIYVIRPNYKDYSTLIPETDRPVLEDGYNLLQRFSQVQGYSDLNVRPLTDLPHPCHLPRPIKGTCVAVPKGNVMEESHISSKIHDLISRLHKAYGRVCTMVDQWFSPDILKKAVKALKNGTSHEDATNATAKKTVTQATPKEAVTNGTATEIKTQSTPKRIRVSHSPRPRIIHNSRYSKVASSGYGRSRKPQRTKDPIRYQKKIPAEPQSLDWLKDMDLNMLVYEMEDLEWRVFEVIYVIKPDNRDYSMLIPETDRPVLDDGYNLLKRLAQIDRYSEVNVRPITDLPHPCHLPRPIKGDVWLRPATDTHDLIRRLHKAYSKLCTMIAQRFSPDALKDIAKQLTVKDTPNQSTIEETVTKPTPKGTVNQAIARESITKAATQETCTQPVPRRIRVPRSPQPRLIHNNRYSKVASSGYGRTKPKPNSTSFTQASSSFVSTTNNEAPAPRGQKYPTMEDENPPSPTKVDVMTVARFNGSRLPVPIRLSSSSRLTTFSALNGASARPNTDIRALARCNGSKLPLPVNPAQITSQPESKTQSTTNVVRHQAQVIELTEKSSGRSKVRSSLYSDIPSSGYGKFKPRVKTGFFTTTVRSVFSTVNTQKPVGSETRPNIRSIVRLNGSKLPPPVKTQNNSSAWTATTSSNKRCEPDDLANKFTNSARSSNVSLPARADIRTPAILKGPELPFSVKQPMTSQSASNNIYRGRNEPPASSAGPMVMPPVRTTSLREFVEMFRRGAPRKSRKVNPPAHLEPIVLPKSPVRPMLPSPRPPSTPSSENGRLGLCMVTPVEGLSKTSCEGTDLQRIDVIFEAGYIPGDLSYNPISRRRFAPMCSESLDLHDRKKVQFDPELRDQLDEELVDHYEPDIEEEKVVEVENRDGFIRES